MTNSKLSLVTKTLCHNRAEHSSSSFSGFLDVAIDEVDLGFGFDKSTSAEQLDSLCQADESTWRQDRHLRMSVDRVSQVVAELAHTCLMQKARGARVWLEPRDATHFSVKLRYDQPNAASPYHAQIRVVNGNQTPLSCVSAKTGTGLGTTISLKTAEEIELVCTRESKDSILLTYYSDAAHDDHQLFLPELPKRAALPSHMVATIAEVGTSAVAVSRPVVMMPPGARILHVRATLEVGSWDQLSYSDVGRKASFQLSLKDEAGRAIFSVTTSSMTKVDEAWMTLDRSVILSDWNGRGSVEIGNVSLTDTGRTYYRSAPTVELRIE